MLHLSAKQTEQFLKHLFNVQTMSTKYCVLVLSEILGVISVDSLLNIDLTVDEVTMSTAPILST